MTGRSVASEICFPFYCPCQTLQEMKDKALDFLKPKEFLSHHRGIYASAIFHFGTLTGAFKKVGVTYRFKEKEDAAWKTKATHFLGRIPDTEIAKCFGVCATTVRRLRRKLDIGPYYTEFD
jgi:hypothetical protein